MTNHSTIACPHTMQVRQIRQETNNVYTLELSCAEMYSYHPGQYALVMINNDPSILRAYTLSSSPGLSPLIHLTIRHISNGVGSSWLTQQVKVGDRLNLSAAQGDFTCAAINSRKYLMLAAGCGVTPIISMTRWLLANRSGVLITVICHIKTVADIIFASEWQQLVQHYPSQLNFVIATTAEKQANMIFGRLSEQQITTLVSDIKERTVMTCGPLEYMALAEKICLSLNLNPQQFHKEQFHGINECQIQSAVLSNITVKRLNQQFTAPVGTTLLYALEQQNIPIIAACRSGVCGSCKTKVISGHYTTFSQITLSEHDINEGYVLACSCQIQGDLVVD